MASALHRQRLATVVEHLVSSGARSVLDLGCGEGELLQQLTAHACFERLVGIDIDDRALEAARRALGLARVPLQDDRTQVRRGSFESGDRDLCGFDAGVLLEVIEHVDPRRLACVERAVFATMRPNTVLVTTPNQEYNILHDLGPGEFRHPGHRFEWPRAKFRQWAGGVAARNGYRVCFFDIGPADPARGSTTQMARFVRPEIGTMRATA
ncbi:methyltransferase [Wenzhouxiangella sp. XN24]|uniref:methyltransferase n=1 Tax=Wenzhouxiangella sp. XN24 TaxID=2713569 RepID=UPI0013EBBDFD|nr:methyltransferase [Wenzhouxiangella sp. XN24]NGX15363.1 methyltransferase domain-containing protein [Wenzhouxiangella sp. XN24]